LQCTPQADPQKQSQRGKRAKVIAQIRAKQLQSPTSTPAEPNASSHSISPPLLGGVPTPPSSDRVETNLSSIESTGQDDCATRDDSQDNAMIELMDRVLNQRNTSSPEILTPSDDCGILSPLQLPPSSTPTTISIGKILANSKAKDAFHISNSLSPPSTPRDGLALTLATGMPASSGPHMMRCIDLYFEHLHTRIPVIHEQTFRRQVASCSPTPLPLRHRCLILALCAASTLQLSPANGLDRDAASVIGKSFLDRVLELRKDVNYVENATLSTITTAFFLHVSYVQLRAYKASRYYLREAVGLTLDLGLHREAFYGNLSLVKATRCRRTLALLFVAERCAVGLYDSPVSIRKTPILPDTSFEDEDPSVIIGFQCIFKLFALLDNRFIEVWDGEYSTTQHSFIETIEVLSKQSIASREFLESQNVSNAQKVNVLVSQQWLRFIFWQVALRQGVLSSNATNPALSYTFPVELAKSLCEILHDVPVNAVLVHGIDIVSVLVCADRRDKLTRCSSRKFLTSYTL
jgi:hypothetical protein